MKPQKKKTNDEMPAVWSIDAAHSTVEFAVRNLMLFTVRGRFEDLSGTVLLDDDLSRASVKVAIDAQSISTGNKRRDTHLRSQDFLAVAQHPEILFESSGVQPGRDRDTLQVDGVLTIRGMSRRISLTVNEVDQSRSPQGEEVVYYSTSTELNRFDFGVKYLPLLIGNKVSVVINLQATRL